jgi:hypothetical protein
MKFSFQKCGINFGIYFVFFLRSLRNLRALCVQKSPVFPNEDVFLGAKP